jgi:hypothetical protein
LLLPALYVGHSASTLLLFPACSCPACTAQWPAAAPLGF